MFCCSTAFGDVFAGIGVREPQPAASEAFTTFGEAHREIERYAVRMLKTVKPVSAMLRQVVSAQSTVHVCMSEAQECAKYMYTYM